MLLQTVSAALMTATLAYAAPQGPPPAAAAPPAASTTPTLSNAESVNLNIGGWQTDIFNVNSFLDQAASGQQSSQTLSMMASTLLQNMPGTAMDEPNRLMTLTALTDADDTESLLDSQDLMQIFPGVLTNLTTIVQNPNDIGAINTAVTLINCLRCNFVLVDIQGVYDGAVASNPGANAAPLTMGPGVCPQPFEGSFRDGCPPGDS